MTENKPEIPKRVAIMRQGINLTNGDRNKTYGSPHPNLTTFAHLVNSYLKGLGWEGPKLDSVDGSMIMVLAKVSRVAVNKQHEDNYVDGSTYFAIAGECSDYVHTKTAKDVPDLLHKEYLAMCAPPEEGGFDARSGAVNVFDPKNPPHNNPCDFCKDAVNPSYIQSMMCQPCGRVIPPKSPTNCNP